MYGVDDTSQYDPRNIPKVEMGKAWPVYKRLLGYVMRHKGRLVTSIVFSIVVAGSLGATIVGTGQVLKLILMEEPATVQPVQPLDAPAQAGSGQPAGPQTDPVIETRDKIASYAKSMEESIGWAPQGLDDAYVSGVSYLRENKMRSVILIAVLVFVFSLVGGVARFLQEYLSASIAMHVTIDLGKEMYANIVRLPIRFFERRSSGEVIARLSNDIFMAGRGLTQVFMKLMREPFKIVMFLGIAIWIDPQLTLVAILVLPLVGFVIVRIGQSVRKRARRSLEKVASLQTAIKESVMGISIVKAFSMEDHQTTRVNHEYGALLKQGLKMAKADAAVGPLTEVVMMIGVVVFIFLSARKVIDGPLDVADLGILYGSLAGMLDPVRKLAAVNNAVQTSVASAERAFEFIDVKSDITDAPDAIKLPPIQSAIRFEDVRFSYDGRVEVLKGISFDVNKGEMVALVGFSGAGKSTVAKLIPRFYDVTGGKITIDGTDIRTVTQASLRGQISLVTQDTILFNESVTANIAAGQAGYGEDRIRAAAKAANAADFVERLRYKYDTPIGESGSSLSGGQRQRLCIARALIKDPAILVLDEATSSLDSESERLIQQAIEEFVVGRTSIVIAHRLSTIQKADRIVVLDDGVVAEQGTHAELLQRDDSIYRRLYETQFAVAERREEIVGAAAEAEESDLHDTVA
ncbi:MAG: hypothetical protein AMXMBFR84_21550 [Candidatus Hydrogenedentota bacterium]